VGAGVDESQQNVEGTVGIGWVFGGGEPPGTAEAAPTDSDGGGVNDDVDQCPCTPGEPGWAPGDARYLSRRRRH